MAPKAKAKVKAAGKPKPAPAARQGAASGGPAPETPQLIKLRLDKIRFAQASFRRTFSDGKTLQETADALRQGELQMGDRDGDLPRVSVVKFHGYWFTLSHRRLEALRMAFGQNHVVEAFEKDLDDQAVAREFKKKFTAGLIATPVDQGAIKDAATAFVTELCTRKDLDSAREACRQEYEDRIRSLAEERDSAMHRFDDLIAQQEQEEPDDAVAEDIRSILSSRCASDFAGLQSSLAKPCSAGQLRRVIAHSVESGFLCERLGRDGDALYSLPGAPQAHEQIEAAARQGVWTLTSSAAVRRHAHLDGRSFAAARAYVACTLSPLCRGAGARALVELRGTWAKGDKLLVGAWPLGTDAAQLFASPGSMPGEEESEHPVAPGHWVSCSSGYWLSSDQNLSPVGWAPPAKEEGVLWGVRLLPSGEMMVACAGPGEELRWGEFAWYHRPRALDAVEDYVPAVLLQPHQRPDDSRAELCIREAVTVEQA